ncbi:MAG: S41 family peptidase [Vallitalea sp.]|jgi:C-terminal processing protease CtpA/Prc|nr:S41 family peptidase [Vallitalea sp.]
MKKLITLLLCGILLVGCTTNKSFNPSTEDNQSTQDLENKKTTSKYDFIYIEKAKSDLEIFKQECLDGHYALINEPKVKDEFINKYNEVMSKLEGKSEVKINALYFMIREIANVLNDGHFYIKSSKATNYLPVKLKWLQEGLVVVESCCKQLEPGDKINMIGNKSIEEIYVNMDNVISAQSSYWVKSEATNLIVKAYTLEWLGCLKNSNSVDLIVEKHDKSLNIVNVKLVTQNPYVKNKLTEVKIKTFTNKNIAIFELNNCNASSLYLEKLEEFFDYVESNNINNILVDLRNNIGGYLYVIDMFLSYINGNVKNYTFADGSSIFNEHKRKQLYNGNIYVATSNKTFSAAGIFTGIMKYNKLATIIGEPTANSNKIYGELSNKKKLKHTRFKYCYSTGKFIFENVEYKDSIYPDINIPLTRSHIINDIDPIEEWINNNKNFDK